MLDRLPNDINLLLADLLIPPPTSRNLISRQRDCQHLSLVHRNWTPVGQHKLFEHLPVVLGEKSLTVEAQLERVEQLLSEGGGRVRVLEIRPAHPELDKSTDTDAATDAVGRVKPETLVLRDFVVFPFLSSEVPDLSVLIFYAYITPLVHVRHLSLASLPLTLTRLHLSHFHIDALPPTFPHLHTLSLIHCAIDRTPECFPFFSSFPSLRTLAWDETAPTPAASFFSHLPPTLRNLLLGIPTQVHFFTVEDIVAVLEAKNHARLWNFTLRAAEEPGLFLSSALAGEKVSDSVEMVLGEANEFDHEEWSLLVG